MIDPRALAKFNTTNDCFRKLFTAEPGTALHELRKTWEERIEARVHEGMLAGVKNYKFYAAADLAWDSNIITKELVPLQLYAQGRIDFKVLKTQLKDLSADELAKFCEVDPKTKEIKSVKLGKFHEIFVNLVRSFITRRTAALALKYTKLYPFLKYEPVSTSWVAKLRGDVLSQRVEMVTNAYGYRHECVQAIRDTLLYGHTVEFAQNAWDVEKQVFVKSRDNGLDSNDPDNIEVETRIVREGVLFHRPHPTRTFWDSTYPLSSINTDTGCSYLGYWSIMPFRLLEKNPAYFNRDHIIFNQSFFGSITAYRGFWELYFPDAQINFNSVDTYLDPAAANDREATQAFYTPDMGDRTLALVEYRERVIPKQVGLGDYPYPVWVRLVVAGDRTVIFGEILPAGPGTYWGYNEDDNRRINNAWAHEIMPWGDQLSNMLSQLLLTQKTGLIKIIAANIDLLSEEQIKAFRSIVNGTEYCTGPTLLEFKGSMLQDMGLEIEDVVKLNEASTLQDITVFFRSIIQLLSLAERVLGVSANESGQSEPREVSATESANIANTVNTTLAFMGLGVDEALDAKKKLLYHSFIAHGSDEIYTPVVNRYTRKTIEAAGFRVEDDSTDPETNVPNPKGQTVIGSKRALVYDYHFSSRDGSERMSNAKAAEVMVNLLAQLTQIPGVLQDMGKEKLYAFLNAVVRMSGAGVDLSFDLQEGEAENVMHGDAALDGKEAIQNAIKMITDAIGQDREKLARLEAMIAQMQGGAPMPPQLPAAAPPMAPAAMAGAPVA